jgi:hypothetical protein
MKRLASLVALMGSFAAAALVAEPAQACGGCFVGPSESTVVTGHRMALSISQERTVLWDQITYAGDPAEFSWVLPVKKGARLELATDAWFEVLEAATRVTVAEPLVNCYQGWDGGYEGGDNGSGFGCGTSSSDAAAPSFGSGGGELQPPKEDVEVVSKESAGPYEVVTLSTDVPGALDDWLAANGYNVPDDIQPIIDAYVADGFDFIALRLLPDIGVEQMKPVRVVTDGSSFALPLRMVAAGTGANTALTLFVVGEGRYQARNFDNALVPSSEVSWDFATSSSNYSELRLGALAANEGKTWLTSYAKHGTLFEPEVDNIAPMWNVSYAVGGVNASTIAEAYVHQGIANGETDSYACLDAFERASWVSGVVVDDCDDEGSCEPVLGDDIGASTLACGALDDIAAGLVGMHLRSVWITRLEADLPRAALATELLLEAGDQALVENRFSAPQYQNHPCGGSTSAQAFIAPRHGPRLPGGPVSLGIALAAALFMARRRRLGASAPMLARG